jgi:predicted GNAT family acetyltransferase
MIRKLDGNDQAQVLEYLYQDPSINIFIIGDIENFGFDQTFQDVYGEFEEGKYQSVLLRYKENFVYYSHLDYFNKEWLEIILNNPHQFISGCKRLTDIIKEIVDGYREKPMYFCEVNEFDSSLELEDEGIHELTNKEEDLFLDFTLMKSTEEFDSMKKTEYDSWRESKFESLKTSKSYVIKEDGKIVSSVSTVADTKKSAMVVAVATDKEYRQKGYASKLMIKLMHEYLVNKKKSLCLFYDNPKAGKIYHRLGFVDKDMWVMLIRK